MSTFALGYAFKNPDCFHFVLMQSGELYRTREIVDQGVTDLCLDHVYELIHTLLNRDETRPPDVPPPYILPEKKILTSTPSVTGEPCPPQILHYDYKLDGLLDDDYMPYSALVAMHGEVTSLTFYLLIDEGSSKVSPTYQEIIIPLLPGDMLI